MYRRAILSDAEALKTGYDYIRQECINSNLITLPSVTLADIENDINNNFIFISNTPFENYTEAICWEVHDNYVQVKWALYLGKSMLMEVMKSQIVFDTKLPCRYYVKKGGDMEDLIIKSPYPYVTDNTHLVEELVVGDEVWRNYEFVAPELGLFND